MGLDSESLEGEVIFAGFCFDKRDQGFDDFAGFDVKGKIVACLKPRFPKERPATSERDLAESEIQDGCGRGLAVAIEFVVLNRCRRQPGHALLLYDFVDVVAFGRNTRRSAGLSSRQRLVRTSKQARTLFPLKDSSLAPITTTS